MVVETVQRGRGGRASKGRHRVNLTGAEGVSWDLADLYSSPRDPALEQDLRTAVSEAAQFTRNHRGRIKVPGGPTARQMARALEDYQGLLDTAYKPLVYARLLHSADTSAVENGALLSKTQEILTQVLTATLFFELDWIAVEDEAAERVIRAPACSRWAHFLKSVRRYKPHTLEEKEEIILAEKSQTGSQAFQRLFDEITSSGKYHVKLKGCRLELSQSEALALLYSPDRETRRAGHRGFSRGLEKTTHLATFIINTLTLDHAVNSRLKRFSDPAASRHLANEIEAEAVQALIESCERKNHIVQDYYRLKRDLLGVATLYDYDRYAPIGMDGLETAGCSWEEACETIIESYSEFSPIFGDVVSKFLKKRWIDAEARPGKRGGAFCSSTVPSAHPYILMNYTGKLRDLMTLAHELGHGVHQYLARPRGILQCSSPLTLAETASVFGEMLVFDRLMNRQSDSRLKLSLLCHKLEDSFATVFRQVALTRFEQKVHAARADKELSTQELDAIWLEVNQSMLGNSVRLTRGYRRWWSYIGHFVHSPFYCYAYAFGELLVLTLWKEYQRGSSSFIPAYIDLLKAGGSDTPARLVGHMGLNINDAGFWETGLRVLEEMVDQARQLASNLSLRIPTSS